MKRQGIRKNEKSVVGRNWNAGRRNEPLGRGTLMITLVVEVSTTNCHQEAHEDETLLIGKVW